jgi:hypothetical protein
MRFGRVGRANLLFESPLKPDGKPDFGGVWNNYGGDKIWPAPQSAWVWPPEPEYDTEPWLSEATASGVHMWTKHPSSITGVLLERKISLSASGTEASIENIYRNGSKATKRLAGWQICQVNDPAWCVLPRDTADPNGKGWSTYDPQDVSDMVRQVGDNLEIHRNAHLSAKFGSKARAGFVLANIGDEMLRLESVQPPGEYVDDGRALQIYISQDPAKYAELEITGPLVSLRPKESFRFKTVLRLRSK